MRHRTKSQIVFLVKDPDLEIHFGFNFSISVKLSIKVIFFKIKSLYVHTLAIPVTFVNASLYTLPTLDTAFIGITW